MNHDFCLHQSKIMLEALEAPLADSRAAAVIFEDSFQPQRLAWPGERQLAVCDSCSQLAVPAAGCSKLSLTAVFSSQLSATAAVKL